MSRRQNINLCPAFFAPSSHVFLLNVGNAGAPGFLGHPCIRVPPPSVKNRNITPRPRSQETVAARADEGEPQDRQNPRPRQCVYALRRIPANRVSRHPSAGHSYVYEATIAMPDGVDPGTEEATSVEDKLNLLALAVVGLAAALTGIERRIRVVQKNTADDSL